MLKNKQFGSSESEEITIVSRGVKIEGKVTITGNIRIDGEIQGDIFSNGNITIGEDAKVNGQINANFITIAGKVSGIVRAKDKMILGSKSYLKGDIFTKILVVEAGAKFNGKSKMGDSIDIGDPQGTTNPGNTITK
jgi:cytoskeletal protein CcmA (bactofilin family)